MLLVNQWLLVPTMVGIEREADPLVVEGLRRKLIDSSTSLSQKYRVLFSLRNISGANSHLAIMEGASIRERCGIMVDGCF
jgi:hypothetical protein